MATPFSRDQATEAPIRPCETLICIPTHNEGRSIDHLIDAILLLPVRVDIVIIDDNSTDGTREKVEARASTNERVGIIIRPGKLGIGSAHRLGWLHARQLGYARIVTLDHDPADIPRLIELPDAGADVVVGSRFAAGGSLDYRGWRLSSVGRRIA